MRRIIAALLIALTCTIGLGATHGAGAADPGAEADFANRVNGLRASLGIGGLGVHPVLTAKAEGWAAQMAATGCLCHSNLPDGVTVAWRKLGENIGRGPNVGSIHAALVASPLHYANMVDRSFQWIGVGVAYGGGSMYVAEVFMNGAGPPSPIGSLDGASAQPGGTRVRGWTISPDTNAPANVDFYMNGAMVGRVPASGNRPDVGAAYPNYGAGHGYDVVLPGTNGVVCVYGIAMSASAPNTLLGCQWVMPTPVGSLDGAASQGGGIRVRGWTIAPDSVVPANVDFYVNGVMVGRVPASGSRPDVGAAFPGYTSNHGYDLMLPGSRGIVCTYGIANAGPNRLLGCAGV